MNALPSPPPAPCACCGRFDLLIAATRREQQELEAAVDELRRHNDRLAAMLRPAGWREG